MTTERARPGARRIDQHEVDRPNRGESGVGDVGVHRVDLETTPVFDDAL